MLSKILAFDATIPSVSIKDGETITSKIFESSDKMKEEVVRVFDKSFKEIRISKGPGSFTGLRVAHALASGLSFSSGVPIRQMDLSKSKEPIVLPFKGKECFRLYNGEVKVVEGLEVFKGALSEVLLKTEFGEIVDIPEPFYGVETYFRLALT